MSPTPTQARYGVRKDGSIWLSIEQGGNHDQFDYDGREPSAALIVKAVNAYDEMVRLLNAVLDEDYSSTTLWCEIAGMLKKLGEEP